MFPVENIRKFALMNGMTLAEVERKLGFGNGVIGKWEKAKRPPDPVKLEMVAELLDATVEELEMGIKKEPLPKERLEWSTAWAEATPEARQAALSVLRLASQGHDHSGEHGSSEK